jgi:hypothetical protein
MIFPFMLIYSVKILIFNKILIINIYKKNIVNNNKGLMKEKGIKLYVLKISFY